MRDFAGTQTTDGYMCLPHNPVGTDKWFLRRYTNSGVTAIATADYPNPSGGDFVLMRRNGTSVEVWHSTDSAANWTLVVSAVDTIYTTGLYPVLGATGNGQTGWDYFGAGPAGFQHHTEIYRWISN
jgi:hypothetical protein